ncbi:uncharacterized protein LOC121970820 isoform X1 [Zingiber officinale]|uniref:uncharacterized protein LOC121970820 isoform X1 n=1 Tax=Zingiber officinale TaxID=94328 RepID=UPI001C4B961E|nr:uncharacterized protein LOC121970820 isoform X1 [Zingiber officinale]
METEGAECNGSVKLGKSPSDDLITRKRRREDGSSADATKVLETPGRNRDIGWNHCVRVGEGKWSCLKCNWCGSSIRSITKIKYHLAGEWGIYKCPKVPAKVRKSIMNQLAEMRMRNKNNRLAQNRRFDEAQMSNPCKDDIVYVVSTKGDKEIQVESAGIFNLKADKQFENTKAATKSSKSADQHSGTASLLSKTDMIKLEIIDPAETVSFADSHPEIHDRICRRWKSAIECQLKLSYVTPGQGIWNTLHAALSFDNSQLSHKLMMNDVIMDNEQLKDIQLGDSGLKLQSQKLNSLSANEQIVLESTASYHEDTNTRKCEKAFLEILISAKFALLCDFLLGIFDENITKSFLDFSLIDSKLKTGDYEQSAELFNQDVELIWNKVQKIGEKMATLASILSSFHKQEIGQVGVIQKNSIVPHATKQCLVGPDCSSKPNHKEASNPNCASICNKHGTEAIQKNSPDCSSKPNHMEASNPNCGSICNKCGIREIPNPSWHCAACSSTDKNSDPVCTDNKKKIDEVFVTEEDLNENGSRTNSGKTLVSSIAEGRAEFSHLSEQLNNISQQLNFMSAIQAELVVAKAGREAAEMQAAEERGKSELLASELECAKVELINYKAGEEGRWANQKKTFLKSPEFFDLLGAQSASVFEYGYRCAMKQFREADYPPDGTSTSFLDPQTTLASIPDVSRAQTLF